MPKILRSLLLSLSLAWSMGQAQESGEHHPPPIRASFYAPKFEGRRMANGQPFHSNVLSAASLKYPLGTILRVTNVKTGKEVLVPVTDRGPWHTRFKLDLSRRAFTELGFSPRQGWGLVTVERI